MTQARTFSGYQIARQSIALTLSVLLIPFATGNLLAQGPPPPPPPGAYAPLDAPSLDQLVAPIALYPDSLVAQILTASTYPQQVTDADNWSRQNAGMPPQQRADIANTMPWDPSVKALTAFPTVLDNLSANFNWMSSLGNAYYNQPGDVMNAVQAARVQAQQAGYLRPTPQERIVSAGGMIQIVPADPAVVFVPYYNPWTIYGGWVRPWGGFVVAAPPVGVAIGLGIGFAAVGISLGLFAHYGWGFNSWSPNWHGGVVVYNHATYISNSVTVINHGNFGGFNRGVFERPGPGVPASFRPPVTAATANFGHGPGGPPNGFNRPAAAARPPAAFNRPPAAAPQAQNYRPPAAAARPAPAPAAAPRAAAPAPNHAAAPQPHAAPQHNAPQQQHAHPEEHEHKN
jgi:hypothetical protein